MSMVLRVALPPAFDGNQLDLDDGIGRILSDILDLI
jgi:hypothetical protein